MVFRVKGMTCGSCARRIERAVHSVDASARVVVDLPRATVDVRTPVEAAAIAAAITAAGYPAAVV